MEFRGKLYYMNEFRNHLVQFLDELIEQFPNEPNFVVMRIFIKDQIPIEVVLGRFVRDILPYRKQVQDRDFNFFIDHPFLYMSEEDMDNVGGDFNYFTKLWQSDALDEADRNVIWSWFDVFMEFGHKYFTQYGYVQGFDKNETAKPKSE